jgi:hypothetical protein
VLIDADHPTLFTHLACGARVSAIAIPLITLIEKRETEMEVKQLRENDGLGVHGLADTGT